VVYITAVYGELRCLVSFHPGSYIDDSGWYYILIVVQATLLAGLAAKQSLAERRPVKVPSPKA
jgi:hypothetical protein